MLKLLRVCCPTSALCHSIMMITVCVALTGCFKCGKEGHISRYCPKGAPGGGQGKGETSDAGADPAIGGPCGRLPLRAWLLRIYCTKMHEIWTVDSQDKIVAIRFQILRLKCTKFDFGWAPQTATGVYSTLQTP